MSSKGFMSLHHIFSTIESTFSLFCFRWWRILAKSVDILKAHIIVVFDWHHRQFHSYFMFFLFQILQKHFKFITNKRERESINIWLKVRVVSDTSCVLMACCCIIYELIWLMIGRFTFFPKGLFVMMVFVVV